MTHVLTAFDITRANFSQYKMIYLPSCFVNNAGTNVRGINDTQNAALSDRKADLVSEEWERREPSPMPTLRVAKRMQDLQSY